MNKINVDIIHLESFTECCDEHDKCYDTCNTNKKTCDSNFNDCLLSKCTILNQSYLYSGNLCILIGYHFLYSCSRILMGK